MKMSSYEEFTLKYSALNIVRNEVGGLSIARRSSDRIYTEHRTDIEAVWLGYDERTRTDTEMRVSITRIVNKHPLTNWLVDPFDGRLEVAGSGDFETVRAEGLIGICAIKSYMQLPRKYQRRLEWIVEDNSQGIEGYVDSVPEVAAIQELIKTGHDPSAAECLTLFDYALRNAQSPQSLS